MRPTLSYTSARILLFVGALLVLYFAGARGALLLALAIVVSGVISLVVLSRQRDQMSGAIVTRFRDMRTRLDEGAKAEDD
ncbi:MAG: DUF4229 domain-containing protein [Actinomycetota bacterium]